MGFGPEMKEAINRIGVAQGEVENVLEAALRDATENMKGAYQGTNTDGAMSDAWPTDNTRDEGTHSIALWDVIQKSKLKFSLVNTADYASFVWIKPPGPNSPNKHPLKGPPGLFAKTIVPLVRAIQEDATDFISKEVADLLEKE